VLAALIDTHVHLDLLTEPDALVAAAAAGVTDVIGIGIDPTVPSVPRVAVPPGLRVHHALGLHPQALQDDAALDAGLFTLDERLSRERSNGVVALGETGLDARHGMPDSGLQQRAFAAQLRLAQRHELPVVLHGVRRDGAMLAQLDEARARGPLRAVWHGFSGSKDTMRLAVARGLYISIGSIVLNENARRVRDAIPHIPADRLLLETDAPPLPPAQIVDVARAVAALRNTSEHDVRAVSSDNARRLFGLAG
jgi:TatD DNase family protein